MCLHVEGMRWQQNEDFHSNNFIKFPHVILFSCLRYNYWRNQGKYLPSILTYHPLGTHLLSLYGKAHSVILFMALCVKSLMYLGSVTSLFEETMLSFVIVDRITIL